MLVFQAAFDWRTRRGQNPVPMFPTLGEGEKLTINEEVMDTIDGHMWEANVSPLSLMYKDRVIYITIKLV